MTPFSPFDSILEAESYGEDTPENETFHLLWILPAHIEQSCGLPTPTWSSASSVEQSFNSKHINPIRGLNYKQVFSTQAS